MKFLLVGFDLLRGQRTKVLFAQAAHKKWAKYAAISAGHTAVKGHPQKDTLIITDNRGPIRKGIDGLDCSAYDLLHLMQAVDLRFIRSIPRLDNYNRHALSPLRFRFLLRFLLGLHLHFLAFQRLFAKIHRLEHRALDRSDGGSLVREVGAQLVVLESDL